MAKTTKTTATPGLSLFAAAAATPAAKTKAKKDRLIVPLDKSYEAKIHEHISLKETIDNATAALKIVDGEIKEVAREKFVELYKQFGRCPENFILNAGKEKILFIVNDKYLKVTEEKQELLMKVQPSVVDVKTEYSFNAELLEKNPQYMQLLSDAITNISDKLMPQCDKVALIKATKAVSIKKGTINNLNQYKNLAEVFEMIEPIVGLKAGE